MIQDSREREHQKKTKVLMTQSGVNVTGKPFVQLVLDDNVIAQFTPSEASQFALIVMQAAEAATSDALLVAWFLEEIESPVEHAFAALQTFRSLRERTGGAKANTVNNWTFPFDPERKPV